MTRLSISALLGLIFLALLGFACAQEQHNFLALDDELLDPEVGPYYFIKQGNNTDAYARAEPLARALGAKLGFDDASKLLRFEYEGTVVTLQTTDNIALGLQKRVGALTVNGQSRVSPLGILVGGSSYVAIGPLIDALGGESSWDAGSRVLFIDSPPAPTQSAAVVAPAAASGVVSPPRYAFHGDKSRVAVNIPAGSSYQVLVADNRFVVSFDGLTADAWDQALDDPFLQEVAFAQLEGKLALSITTRYPLDPSGAGYKLALLPPSGDHPDEEVLYVDFAPELRGHAAARLEDAPTVLAAAEVKRPKSRKVVVIDAGHGGHDPGALSSYATEKEVVLAVAKKLEALLEAQGIEVILTRDGDYFLTLAERATFAKPEINLFVSIHANAAPSASASGIETWVFGQPLDAKNLALAVAENGGGAEGEARTQEALAVANTVTGSLMRAAQLSYSLTLADMVQREMVAATGARDRGVQQNAFYVIRNARSPAILVELGFVTNPDEGRKLTSDAYQTQLAQALAAGIMDFFAQGSSLANR